MARWRQGLDNRENFFPAQNIVAVLPALEREEAFLFGVDLLVQVIILLPQGAGRIQALEILHQPCAVEAAVCEVGQQMHQSRTAQQPACRPHGGASEAPAQYDRGEPLSTAGPAKPSQ